MGYAYIRFDGGQDYKTEATTYKYHANLSIPFSVKVMPLWEDMFHGTHT